MGLSTQEQILQEIKKSDKILITFKKNQTPDTIASAISLYLILKKLRKDVSIMADHFKRSERLKFLPNQEAITSPKTQMNKFVVTLDISKNKIDEFSYDITDDKLNIFISPKNGYFEPKDVSFSSTEFKYDLIISVDTTDIEQLGQVYSNHTEFFYRTRLINLDHLAENERFGQINHIDLTATSTTEVIYDLFFPKNNNLMDEEIATCLLTGIISETKSFKTPKITPKTLNIVGQLISSGGKREEIINHLYRTKSITTLKLWGKILMNLEFDSKANHVWSQINLSDFQNGKVNEEVLIEIIEELITNSPQAKIVSLFYEFSPNSYKAYIYTTHSLNALELTKSFKPEGTKHLAKITIDENDANLAKQKVLNSVSNFLEQIPETNR